ncbi:MAG: cytochrome P450 [Gemmatimonadaceae bacterium]
MSATAAAARRTPLPPGPRGRWPGQLPWQLVWRPLELLPRLAREYGDVSSIGTVRGTPIVFLAHPDDVRDVLVTNQKQFAKGRGIERTKLLLGEGLLTSEGPFHRRQRRLAQPAFHRDRIAAYGDVMGAYASQRTEAWRPGAAIDVHREMMALTLAIAGKTLFDADVESEAREIGEALTVALESFHFALLPFSEYLEKVRFLPPVRRFAGARARLDETVYRLIADRRRDVAAGRDRGDLLTMLVTARDTEGDGGGMSDLQLRDEAMTILLAGHETTANALTWTLYLLARNPEAEARLHAEIDAAAAEAAGRPFGAADLPRLTYARMVLAESMRLFPPAWAVSRRALGEYPVGDYVLPENSLVLVSQYVTHRDARWWPNPERFDPERWLPERAAERPKFAYFPFGGGTRICVGEPFAWMEGTLVLAELARRWRLRLAPGYEVEPQPLVTLRPRRGMPMVVEARRPAAR